MAELGRRMPVDRDLARAWQGVLGRLQFKLSRQNWETWLKPTVPLGFEGETLLVHTPNAFHLDWLQQQFGTMSRRELAGELGRDVDLRFVGEEVAPPVKVREAPVAAGPCGINRSLTFGNYMSAAGNELAIRACQNLSGEGDEAPISPVVLFGTPGSGKSHLLHATANCARERGATVVLLTGEDFANGYQDAIRKNGFEAFREHVRSADLFILDDLQYLAGKPGTLEQLRQTIDTVTNRGGHVIVASEEHPRSLNLPESLASRLYGGLMVCIGDIRACERRAFVEHVARALRASLPPWCLDRIAAVPSGSPRELRGAVHMIVNLDRCGRLDERTLDEAMATMVVSQRAPAQLSASEVIERVAQYFNLGSGDITGRSRAGTLPDVRAMAVAALADTGKSLSQIGALLDGRDASTVSPLVERGRKLLEQHPEIRTRLAG